MRTELVDRARSGEQAAFAILATGTIGRFRAIAVGILHDPDQAEDAAQETFLAFARRAVRGGLKCLKNRRLADIKDVQWDQYIPDCRSYLICILMRKCYQFCRPRRFCPRVHPKGMGHLAGPPSDPGAEMIRQERQTRAQQAIARLPKRLRQIVALRFFARYSEKDTAALLKIPVGTVKSRMHCLKKRLRSLLPPEVEEDL
jgi:RNA polymerase sigma-70 factor (ECF subfamily)